MSADSPRRSARGIPAIVPPQVVSDRSIIDSVAGFISDVTLNNQPQCDPKDTITWARFETAADISDTRYCDDWELEGNVAPPLLLILGYGQGVQVWAIPANGEAVEVLSWRHGIVSSLRVLPTPSYAENGRADEPIDTYADKRPLMAICDGTTPAGSNPQFCAVNFVSLKTGAQVKTIKFKNPVLDILANRSSIVITFHERIAVFDARSLEDRLSVTTCFPSPGINPNPVALGSRWMAYSENKLLHSKRSGGGCDGDGVSSYTATVLNAAKSFGKGLRELGEQVAAGLTGTTGSGGSSKSSSFDSATGDLRQGGVVTILDIKHPIKDVSPTSGTPISINGSDPIVAHFIAHSEAVVAMEFDNSGMMLLTADRRGHDFHLFRIQPHPVGSSLAAVHHLYVLHRGDTSAKVQNITFSLDSRWVAVSTLRGTTHVFPVTPYGGPAGVRTHTSLHVVNKLSRFHRSAGLSADGRSSSPISHSDSTNFSQMLMPYHNPTLPPFPRPTVVLPLAQLRQPFALGSPPGSAVPSSYGKTSNTRQRLSSLSDDNGKPLSVCAVFAKSRSWLLDPPNAAREAPHKIQRKAVDSLFVMAGHGALIQYDLDTKLATSVAKEKICDDTPIELDVEAKAQWNLGRKDGSLEVVPPLTTDNWLIKDKNSCMLIDSTRQYEESDDRCDSWLSQVEIITHAGPHRRLWMGPQFVFKTYNTPSGSNLSHIDVEAVEIGVSSGPSNTNRPGRSSPLNMPLTATGRSAVPVLIESGSYSSIEQSPKLMDRFRHEHMNSDFSVAHGDNRLKEDLADAMRESPSVSHKDSGGQPQRRRPSAAGSSRRATASSSPSSSPKTSGSGGVSSASSSSSAATMVGGCGGVDSNSSSSQYESLESLIQQQQQEQQHQMKTISIENVVNPLGTVTTITGSCDSELDADDIMKGISVQSYVIHENCDESLFRPVVAIFCDENSRLDADRLQEDSEFTKPPEAIGNKLIVPVIEKAVDIELTKKESLKNRGRRQQQQVHQQVKEESDDEVVKFNITDLNRKQKIDKKKQMKDEVTKQLSSTQKQNSSPVEIGPAVSFNSKEKQKKQSKEETPKVKSSDPVVKSKSDKGRKSVERESLVEELSALKKHSEPPPDESASNVNIAKSKSLKTRKSVEKDAVSDEDCWKKCSSDNALEKPLKSDKSSKGRKSVDKEMSPDPSVMEKKSPNNESKLKTSKSTKIVEKSILPEEGSKIIKPASAEDVLKSKSSKSRKSEEKDVLTDEVSILETHSYHFKDGSPSATEKTTTKTTRKSVENESPSDEERKISDKISKGPLKQKGTKGRKSIEKELLSDVATTLETHFDHFESETQKKTLDSNIKPMKSSKLRKSVEKEIVSAYDAPTSANSSRKSSVIELKTSMEDESTKKTNKERKGDAAEEVIAKLTSKSAKSSKVKENSEDEIMKTSVVKAKPQSLENFEEEKPIEFKRMTASSSKPMSRNSKADKNAQVKPKFGSENFECKSTLSLNKPRAKSPDECAAVVVDGKYVSEIASNKKKRLEQDNKTPGVPLSIELSNASDLADSMLDFRQDKAENEGNSSGGKGKSKGPNDNSENESPSTLPSALLEEDNELRLDLENLPPPPSELLASVVGNLSEATDTIITVEEKELDVVAEVSSGTKSTIQSKKKSKACINKKADKTSSENRSAKPCDDSLVESVSRSGSVVSVEKITKRTKPSKVLEFSDSTLASSENDLTSSKITIEPIEVHTFLSDLIDSQKVTNNKTKSSPTRTFDSPKKSISSPLKFVDAYGDSFVTPVVPLKKEKSHKKKPTPERTETLSDSKPEPSFKSYDGIQFFDSFLREGVTSSVESSTAPWKPLTKVENTKMSLDNDYPDLGKAMRSKKTPSPPADKKEIFFSVDIRDEKKENKSPKTHTTILDELPTLKPLEDLSMDFLPPLAPLEPLEGADENMSLINFESPLQETSKLIKPQIEVEKVSPQFPKGFPADNIIFALCGSLHYENENSGKPLDSPLTLSFSDSTAHTTAEYKSLTENDDQYLSLEQSSQENAPSTSSSTCEDVTEAAYSSGGGIGLDVTTCKTKSKQRRKKQLITAAEDDDEELRPLISKNDDVNLMASSMTVSTGQSDDRTSVKNKPLPPLDNSNQVNSDSSSSDQAMTSEDADVAQAATDKPSSNKSVEDEVDMTASSIQSPQPSQSQSQQQLPNSSKKKLKRRKR